MYKLITDDKLPEFIPMYIAMHKVIYPGIPESVILLNLVQEMQQPDFAILGDFKDGKLVGFTCGHRYKEDVSGTTYFCSGWYHTIPFRAVKLIIEVEKLLLSKGYTKWVGEHNIKEKTSIIPKLGAKVKTIVYEKEL